MIISYDNDIGEVFVPNKEILDEFKAFTADDARAPVFESFQASEKLLEATWAKDEDAVAEALEKAHVYSYHRKETIEQCYARHTSKHGDGNKRTVPMFILYHLLRRSR